MAPDESPLTPRETEILTLIGQGFSNKAVARRLGISVHTVKFHIETMFGKLDASSRAEAVAKGTFLLCANRRAKSLDNAVSTGA